MNIKKQFQSTKIPGEQKRKEFGKNLVTLAEENWDIDGEVSFKPWFKFGFVAFAVLALIVLPLKMVNFGGETSQSGLDFGATVSWPVGENSLVAECGDRDYLNNTADYVLEGTVSEVANTYVDLKIVNYVKGAPFDKNVLRIYVPASGEDGMRVFVEDQPVFDDGAMVRIYLVKINGEFVILCGFYGLENISGDLIYYGIDEGCNFEGENAMPVSESINLSQDGSSVKFEQMIQFASYSYGKELNFDIEYSRSGNDIEVREIYSFPKSGSGEVTPVCSKSLFGQIDNLEEGFYNFTFILENKVSGETRVLGEKEFELIF